MHSDTTFWTCQAISYTNEPTAPQWPSDPWVLTQEQWQHVHKKRWRWTSTVASLMITKPETAPAPADRRRDGQINTQTGILLGNEWEWTKRSYVDKSQRCHLWWQQPSTNSTCCLMPLVLEQAELFYGEHKSERWLPRGWVTRWKGSGKCFQGGDWILFLVKIHIPRVYAFVWADPWVTSGLVCFILNKTRSTEISSST